MNTLISSPRSVKALLILCLVGVAGSIVGQENSVFSLFESDSIVNVRLETDLKVLVKQKHKEEYQPATLSIKGDTGDWDKYEIKVKSRGNRRKEVCYYPPIFVNFPKSVGTFSKVKWVLPCRDSDSYDQILLKEYLCYKLFDMFSDKTFRTALLRVELVDKGRDDKTSTRYAFAIEPIDQVAERMGGREYSPKVMQSRLLNEDQEALFYMFQYMVGNTDWAVANSHNINAVTDTLTKSIIMLPYDYDYSGLVGTTYAVPHESVPIDNVADRYNKGFCISEELAEKYRLMFLEKQ